MWLSVILFVPAELFAQNEATLGKWDRLYYNNAVIRWRVNSSSFGWDQLFTDANNVAWSRARAWNDIYGIHAALLPTSGETGALQRGWVILWGYNDERTDRIDFLVAAPQAEPYYFAALAGYYVPRLATTSVLLWHPEEGETEAAKHGYVRYLFDAHPWNDPGEYPPYNLFCSGHALLSDGQLFVAGGHGGLFDSNRNNVGYIGLRLLSIFQAQNFRRSATAFQQSLWWTYFPPAPRSRDEQPEPRWYPSVAALPDGKVLIVGGTWYGFWGGSVKNTNHHEIFDPCTRQVARSEVQPPSPLRGNYPRVHLVSFVQGGQLRFGVVYTGPHIESYFLETPSSPYSTWESYRDALGNLVRRAVSRHAGASVLLPNPVENPQNKQDQVLYRVLTIGGSGDRVSQTLSYDLNDFSNGALSIARYFLPYRPRIHLNAVLLPTGQVLVVGGHETYRADGSWYYPDDVVLQTLLYTPPENSSSPGRWDVVALAPQEVSPIASGDRRDIPEVMDGTRVYHSTALLLPDGRVLTAGSATNDSAGRSVNNYVPTLYSPPYLFKPDGSRRGENERPRILSLSHTELNYGQNFEMTFQLADDSHGIRSVALMRPGSATHSFDFEQRLVRLRFKQEDPLIQATAPWHPGIAPPGWYMLFLVDENGVPSKAAWVRLKHECGQQAAQLIVSLEGVQDISAEQREAIERSPITLELRDAATGATLETYTLPMARPDEQGQVRLALWSALPAGTYELYVHPYRSWLGRRVWIDWQRGGSYRLLLRNGDVVQDNAVDLADLAAVLTQLGVQDVCAADVNCDGIVDTADVALVATNVGTEGDE